MSCATERSRGQLAAVAQKGRFLWAGMGSEDGVSSITRQSAPLVSDQFGQPPVQTLRLTLAAFGHG